MICAYLLHRDRCKDAEEVLSFYGQARTFNAKVGVAPGLLVGCTALLHLYFVFMHLCNHLQYAIALEFYFI